MKKACLALCLALVFAAGCSLMSSKPAVPDIEIVDYGIYENGRLVFMTMDVQKKIGTTFGFHFKVNRTATGGAVKAVITTQTPGIISPSGKIEFSNSLGVTLEPGKVYECFFSFQDPRELVDGNWTLSVTPERGDTFQQLFQVYSPKPS